MVNSRIWLTLFVGGAWLAALTGCEPAEHIEQYTVEKPPPIDPAFVAKAPAADTLPSGEPTDRMLAAIVPLKEQGWFFKLTGPKDAVAAQAEPFARFLNSVRFSSEGKPQWTLPEGWQEQPGSQLRFATLVIPAEPKPLEVSVTVLPNSGEDDEAYVLLNVNRWRGQLRLPPTTKEQLAGEGTQVPLDGATATVVNLLGTAAPDGMGRPPFMSGARDGN